VFSSDSPDSDRWIAFRKLGISVNQVKQVLFIGNSAHGEFSAALSWLRGRGPLVLKNTVEAGLAWLKASREEPGAIVLGVTRRGEHALADLSQLTGTAPLAQPIVLVGSWCEGETRSGRPPQGWRRIYWHQVGRWAAGEMLAPAGVPPFGWQLHPAHLPRTSTDGERVLAWSKWALPSGGQRIAVNTSRRVDFETLASVCALGGYEAIWCQQESPDAILAVDCVLWNRRGLQGDELVELMEWRERWGNIPLIATIGFPRPQDYQLVDREMVQAIVGKPFLLPDLFFALKKGTGWQAAKAEAA